MFTSSFPIFASADEYPGTFCTDRLCDGPFKLGETVFRTECSVCELEAPFKGLNIRHLQCAYKTLKLARTIRSENLLGLFTCSEGRHEPVEEALAELVAHSHLLEADIGRRIGHRRTLSESAVALTGSVVNFAGEWFHKGRDFVSKSVAGSQRPIIDSAAEALRSQRFGNLTRKMLGEGAVTAYPEVRDDAASQVSGWRAIRVRPRSAPGSPTRLSERGIVRARSHESLFSEFEKISLGELQIQDEGSAPLEAGAAALEPETATYVVTRLGKTHQEFNEEWVRQRALASIKIKAVGLQSEPIETTDLVGNVTFTVRWQKKQDAVGGSDDFLVTTQLLEETVLGDKAPLDEADAATKNLDDQVPPTRNSSIGLNSSVHTVVDPNIPRADFESSNDFVPIVADQTPITNAEIAAATLEKERLLVEIEAVRLKLDDPNEDKKHVSKQLVDLRDRVMRFRSSRVVCNEVIQDWERVSQLSVE